MESFFHTLKTNAPLSDKAQALPAAIEAAGVDIVEKGAQAKLGPEGAIVAEMAVPLLNSVISAAKAKIATLTAEPHNDLVHGA